MAVRTVFEPGWESRIDGGTAELLERLGVAIEADAKVAAPVLTGALRESIEHEVDGDTLRVGSNLHYAAPVEEGHRIVAWGHETGKFQPPQPYLRPALYRRRG